MQSEAEAILAHWLEVLARLKATQRRHLPATDRAPLSNEQPGPVVFLPGDDQANPNFTPGVFH